MQRFALLILSTLVLYAPALAQDYDPDGHALDHGGVPLGFDHGVVGPDLVSGERGAARAQDPSDVNRAIVQQAYADFAAGDVEAFLAILDPHVTWTDAEGYPYAGTYIGPNGLVEGLIARIGAEWDDYTVVPTAYVADGNRVVALGTYSGTYKATGRSVEAPFAHVWQFVDRKVVRFRQFTDGPPWQRAIAP